jgi:hypothetical protein
MVKDRTCQTCKFNDGPYENPTCLKCLENLFEYREYREMPEDAPQNTVGAGGTAHNTGNTPAGGTGQRMCLKTL